MRSNRVEKGLFSIPAYLASAGQRTARVSTHTCPQLLQSPARRYADATGAGRIASSALDTTIAGRWSRAEDSAFLVSEAGFEPPRSSRLLAGFSVSGRKCR